MLLFMGQYSSAVNYILDRFFSFLLLFLAPVADQKKKKSKENRCGDIVKGTMVWDPTVIACTCVLCMS